MTPKKRILYCSNFKYFLFLSFPLNPWTLQILRYIWHFHVFVSQKFIYNKTGIRRNRLKHRPNKMIRQSVHTLFRPAGGPSNCPSVSSFIHPSIQTSEQLIKNLGQKNGIIRYQTMIYQGIYMYLIQKHKVFMTIAKKSKRSL